MTDPTTSGARAGEAASERERAAFSALVEVCRRLRAPDGCPWDREQTLETMTPYLTEEATETAEAIAENHEEWIAEELGDLLFLSVFCLELLGERGRHGLADSLERAAQKLIRRHPHVWGDAQVGDGDAAYRQWQEIKKQEQGTTSLLGKQPKGLPALVAAYRIQEKAAAVGFDWPDRDGALAKVREEFGEVEEALRTGADTDPALAREIGDLLFAIVNVARRLRVDPERELRASSHRFRDRFHHIERRLAERGVQPRDATLAEMDVLWEEAKALARTLPSEGSP
jgi:MazG family protein